MQRAHHTEPQPRWAALITLLLVLLILPNRARADWHDDSGANAALVAAEAELRQAQCDYDDATMTMRSDVWRARSRRAAAPMRACDGLPIN
jgi:hypothetical protein